jgi:diaminopimelate decarboxylase
VPRDRPAGDVRGGMGQGVLTPGVARRDGVLHVDGVSLARLAEAVGTPAYVYSLARVRAQYARLASALASAMPDVPHRLHFSVKANSNLAILRTLQECGAGVDIVSAGELFRAREAGFGGADIVFSGVGKTADELRQALEAPVLFVNVESEGELRLLDEVAAGMGVVAPVALRINPEVTVENPHAYIRTGEKGHKFGIPYDDAESVAQLAHTLPHVALVGLDMHIGSQIATWEPYARALARIRPLFDRLRALGVDTLQWLDLGGGLGVTYEEEAPADVERFAAGVAEAVRGLGVRLVFEPGRFLVAEAGILLARVLYRKRSGGTEYIITDAGMNDLVRPSHYQAYHRIEPVTAPAGRVVADVVGPVCESGDFLALGREMAEVAPGDLLAVHTAGAYGFVMASNYNSRPRPVEVVVDGDRYAVATERERLEDLVRLERAHLQWRSA